MSKKILLFLVTVSLCAGYVSRAQPLLPDEFWQMVQAAHPVARQALLLEQQGEQALLYARGAFDPKFQSSVEQKTFDGKTYYTHGQAGVKLPTTLGVQLKTEYHWTNGVFLNPELQLPSGGQLVVGADLPLLRGLFFDEARSEWRQAQVGELRFMELARSLRNYLYQDAYKAYWDWAWAYHAKTVMTNALNYSTTRLEAVKQSFLAGDNPAIDTLEAYLQVQSWEMELQEATMLLQQAEAQIRAMLWQDEQPLDWRTPSPVQPAQFTALEPTIAQLETMLQQHPALMVYRIELEQLAFERRWKKEQFKPELTLQYNLLGNGFNLSPGDDGSLRNLLTNNVKWGLRFSYPLWLRKERSGLALTEIKITQTEWKLRQKEQELRTQLQAYWEVWQLRKQQNQQAQNLVQSYRSLLEAEVIKFELGESSIFLLNTRQQKLLEAELKQLKVQTELQKAQAALWYVVGQG